MNINTVTVVTPHRNLENVCPEMQVCDTPEAVMATLTGIAENNGFTFDGHNLLMAKFVVNELPSRANGGHSYVTMIAPDELTPADQERVFKVTNCHVINH